MMIEPIARKRSQLGYTYQDDYGNTWESSGDDYTPDTLIEAVPDTSFTVTPTGTVVVAGPAPTAEQKAAVAAANPSDSSALSWLTALAAQVPKVLQLYNAQQIAAVNVQRAQQGLMPLNPALYGPQVGVALPAGAQSGLMWIALGGAALLLLGRR